MYNPITRLLYPTHAIYDALYVSVCVISLWPPIVNDVDNQNVIRRNNMMRWIKGTSINNQDFPKNQ